MKSIQLFSRMALFLALMILSAYIQITLPTPFMPMHITMQLFTAILCGFCLPNRYAFLCMFTSSWITCLCQRWRPAVYHETNLWLCVRFSCLQYYMCHRIQKKKSSQSERILSCRTHRTYQFLCSRKYLLLFFLSHLDEYPHSFMVIFNQRIFGFHHSRYINLFSCLQSRKNSTDTYQVTPATGRRFLFASFQM